MARKSISQSSCLSAGKVTARLLLSFFAVSPLRSCIATGGRDLDFQHAQQQPLLGPVDVPSQYLEPDFDSQESEFELRHIFHHGTYKYPDLHRRLDIPSDTQLMVEDVDGGTPKPASALRARSNTIKIQRLADRSHARLDALLDAGRTRGDHVSLSASEWTVDDIQAPLVTDKVTLLSLAKVAANAYVQVPNTEDWLDLGNGFNSTVDFGWELDGLRGHIYANKNNRTIIVGLKGTSPALFDGKETTTNDKINDNLFFSCCCGQGSVLYHKVCDCQTDTYTCNSTCVAEALNKKNRYFSASQDLYRNVTALYPQSNVWLVGHSLGGAVSSLLGQFVGQPVVTFEAVPEAMAAKRLGLPTPPEYTLGDDEAPAGNAVFHFGNTADSIYMGTCNGWTAGCSAWGYAMQSQCHTGKRCVYDTVKDLGLGQGITYHQIHTVISNVLEKYDEPARCLPQGDCVDCNEWYFFESNSSDPITTTKSSSTTSSYRQTRTETCKTPGWWGCLDKTTTTSSVSTSIPTTTTTTTSSSSSKSTSTCKTPGWFWCLDESTTSTKASTKFTSATTTASALTSSSRNISKSSTTTSTCKTPGFFWCRDKPKATTTSSKHVSTSKTTTSTCRTPGWFGRCYDKSTSSFPSRTWSSSLQTITSPPSYHRTKPSTPPNPSKSHKHSESCTSKAWFGLICLDPSPTSELRRR